MSEPTQFVYLVRVRLVRPDYTRHTEIRAFTSLAAAMAWCCLAYDGLGELQYHGAPTRYGDVMGVCLNGLDLGTITQVPLNDTSYPS